MHDPAEREELRSQLLEMLHRAFDERRERQSRAIDRLGKELEELRALHAERGERKDEIVQRRMSELLAEPDVLAWEPPQPLATAPARQPSRGPVPMPSLGPLQRLGAVPTTSPRRAEATPAIPSPTGEGGPSRDDGQRVNERTPLQKPRATAEARETWQPVQDPDVDVAFRSPEQPSGAAVRFEDAERILELLADVAELEAQLASGAYPREQTKRRLELARRKLEVAEVGWAQAEQLARYRVDAVEGQRKRAEERLKQLLDLFKKGAVPTAEVKKAQVELEQAQAALQTAQHRLRAWEQSDAIIQKHRASLESHSKNTSIGGNAGDTDDDEVAADGAQEAVSSEDP